MSTLSPGRELDALIAEKVFGKPFEPYAKILTSFPAKSIPETPFYSTDIAAAWEVVDNLTSKYDVNVSAFEGEVVVELGRSFEEPEIYGRAETAPHAICLAALKAVNALPHTVKKD